MVLTIVIFVLIGLILGILFLKHYDNLDQSFFKNSFAEYQSFGKEAVMMSTAGGAIFGCATTFNLLAGNDIWHTSNLATAIIFTSPILLFVAVSFGIFQSFVRMQSIGQIIGKSIFMLLACLIGFIIGGIGSFIVITVIIIYILALFIGGALKSTPQDKAVKEYNEEAEELNNERWNAMHDPNYKESDAKRLQENIDRHNDKYYNKNF